MSKLQQRLVGFADRRGFSASKNEMLWRSFVVTASSAAVVAQGTLVFLFAIRADAWIHGEYLVNFADGYVRRGLVGEIFIGLAQTVSPRFSIPLFQSVAYLLLILSMYRHCLSRARFHSIALLLAPSGLLFFLIDPYQVTGRKEVIFLAVTFGGLALIRNYGRKHKVLVPSALILMFGLVFAFHEGFAIFAPAIAYVAANLTTNSRVTTFLAVLAPAAINLMLAFAFRPDTWVSQCQLVLEYGYKSDVCAGAIQWTTKSLKESIEANALQWAEPGFATVYGLAIIMTFVILLYGLKSIKDRKACLVTAFVMLSAGVLIILAVDTGRYLSIALILGLGLQCHLKPEPPSITKPAFRRMVLLFSTLFLTIGFSGAGGWYRSLILTLIEFGLYLFA